MYITNTSFAVEPLAQTLWLDIIKDKFIPFLKENGFDDITFSRVISVDTPEHFTYSLQVRIEDMPAYKKFTDEMMPQYTTIAEPLFGSNVLWFNSLMKRLEL